MQDHSEDSDYRASLGPTCQTANVPEAKACSMYSGRHCLRSFVPSMLAVLPMPVIELAAAPGSGLRLPVRRGLLR